MEMFVLRVGEVDLIEMFDGKVVVDGVWMGLYMIVLILLRVVNVVYDDFICI